MASLADIPTHLLSPVMQVDFLHWLAQRPVDEQTAMQFMRLWTGATQKTFDADDWNFIARTFRR